jgi:hypothetical protein
MTGVQFMGTINRNEGPECPSLWLFTVRQGAMGRSMPDRSGVPRGGRGAASSSPASHPTRPPVPHPRYFLEQWGSAHHAATTSTFVPPSDVNVILSTIGCERNFRVRPRRQVRSSRPKDFPERLSWSGGSPHPLSWT